MLNRMVRVHLLGKAEFGYGLEGGEGVSQPNIWRGVC